MDITWEQGAQLVKNLEADGKETIQSLMPLCSKFALNVICESAMGVALDNLETKTLAEYTEATHMIGNVMVYRMPRPYIRDWMMKLVPFAKICRDQKRALTVLHNFTANVVKQRKEYHERTGNKYLQGLTEENIIEEENDIYMGRRKRLAMLDLLLSAEKDGLIDEAGIAEEVDTFTFEGHDTTSLAMTFSLLLLAKHKDVQDKARTEINEILSKSKGKIGMAEINEFYYLERCLKESMRLYPPVSTIFRRVETDLQLKHGLVPAGANVICHIFGVHRDPNFWSEPEKFDPDRFLFENVQNRHPFAYLPFSAGPRNCIGQKFALMELKSFVARILHNFYLEPIDRIEDMKLMAHLILRPSKPMRIKFIKIDKKY